jgi:V/A-type H+-transporting ATPase subunit D
MAIKFQYNKTSLQQLQKQLKIRQRALPILKSKESALRLEVKKAQNTAQQAAMAITAAKQAGEPLNRLWVEFPDMVVLRQVTMQVKRIAGVKIPVLGGVDFTVEAISLFNRPAWLLSGVEHLKRVVTLHVEHQLAQRTVTILEYARRKTTQKVNLYEKVQIPGYEEAIRKIKRFLEDEENLSKASQKIVKVRLALEEAMA